MKAFLAALALFTGSAPCWAIQYNCHLNETNINFSTVKLSFAASQKCWNPCYMSGGAMTKISDTEYKVHLDYGFTLEPLHALDMKINILPNSIVQIQESSTFSPRTITFEHCVGTVEPEETP